MSKKIQKLEPKITKAPARSAVKRIKKPEVDLTFKYQSPLYSFVYKTKSSILVALMLLLSFAFQGIDTVYAADEEITTETAMTETSVEEQEVVVDEEFVIEEVNVTDEEGILLTENEAVSDDEVEEVPSETEQLDNEETTESEEVLAEQPDTTEEQVLDELVGDGNGDTSEEETDVLEEENEESSTEEETEQVEGDESEEEAVATTTDDTPIITTDDLVGNFTTVESDSAFSFTKDQCTRLATGSFYCLEPQENTLADALFSAQDAEGDMEIYFIRNNEQVQITDNVVDDAAPYYDQNTDTIVWHRLIDDRFQIISYDVERGLETQLTKTSENNMEPTRQGDYTVWQRWVDGGWNIVLHSEEGERQITKTTSHNVAPYIHGTLVVWNRHTTGGEKTIEMYDIATEAYVTVDDPEGLSVSNPRMVFVYDSLHPNGDIVTKGYDVLARKFIELDTLPRDLPEEIPNSDSTGETRALIQSKPSLKSEVEEMASGNGTTTPNTTPGPTLDTASTTAPALTLDMSSSSTVPTVVTPALTESEIVDLVIPPFESIPEVIAEAVQE